MVLPRISLGPRKMMQESLYHSVQPDSFSTDDAFSTDGAGQGRFMKSVIIDLILIISARYDQNQW